MALDNDTEDAIWIHPIPHHHLDLTEVLPNFFTHYHHHRFIDSSKFQVHGADAATVACVPFSYNSSPQTSVDRFVPSFPSLVLPPFVNNGDVGGENYEAKKVRGNQNDKESIIWRNSPAPRVSTTTASEEASRHTTAIPLQFVVPAITDPVRHCSL